MARFSLRRARGLIEPGAVKGRRSLGVVVLVVVATALALSASSGQALRSHAPTFTQQCADPNPASRDPTNPLMLPSPPGENPLNGAHFFIDGPRHGAAAGAIAQLLGIDPTTYPDNYSWSQFQADLSPGGVLYPKLAANPALAHQVSLLERIGAQAETQAISLYSQGGGTAAIYSQAQKILCHNLTADPDPHPIPVFTTFFIYPNGKFCPTLQELQGNQATFMRQITELAQGVGRRPSVFLVEIDALGTSNCLTPDELTLWEADLRYEVQALTALPHTVVYLEAGAADEDDPGRMAQLVRDTCVVNGQNVCPLMRGVWINGTHFDWTNHEALYATTVSSKLRTLMVAATHQDYVAHYVINTAQNGQGPKLNPHPLTQGIEDLCNPEGRGIGLTPVGSPPLVGGNYTLNDGLLWTGVPGRSHNANCHPGDAAAGVFDVRFALELAANASNNLGPVGGLLPPPDLGVSFDALPVSGVIYVKLPGHQAAGATASAARFKKGGGYVKLTTPRSLPVGTKIDSRRGVLQLISATTSKGQTQTGTFGGSLFSVLQSKRVALKGLTTLNILEKAFGGAPSFAGCPKVAHLAGGPLAAIAKKAPASVLQTLRARDNHGRFRTRGRYSAGTTRGTVWDTIDRCDGTLTVVHRGTVVVRDFPHHRTVVVHAGHKYLAHK